LPPPCPHIPRPPRFAEPPGSIHAPADDSLSASSNRALRPRSGVSRSCPCPSQAAEDAVWVVYWGARTPSAGAWFDRLRDPGACKRSRLPVKCRGASAGGEGEAPMGMRTGTTWICCSREDLGGRRLRRDAAKHRERRRVLAADSTVSARGSSGILTPMRGANAKNVYRWRAERVQGLG
jgi:hypothetical protein